MSEFKWHFEGEIVLWAVRWYCRYEISYHDLEQMMSERGVGVEHFTIYRWVQRYAPEIEKVALAMASPAVDELASGRDLREGSRQVVYLYPALDKEGNTIDLFSKRCMLPYPLPGRKPLQRSLLP